ncbi:LysM peptidoglycan-binding domain-containing protein [Oceanobacillus senegalensis]|uniref:C40 family peptidase n=1 Tax=Oceanobacillus senegalensis TaxID=1936063 RepID=UPI000A310287|nr:LysM peptidoglycan-binding domain-containing protein [Oceanobacillus senegalensis]
MANKKIMMSVTTGAAIASAMIGAEEAEASSYKVQSGDSLWSIAQEHQISVNVLKEINNLSSDIIYPNQMLQTVASDSSEKTQGKVAAVSNSTSTTYTVKAGDTLSMIASNHNISLQELMSWNGLETTLIYPGNELVVKKDAAKKETSTTKPSTKTGSSSVYTVKSGDTLSKIASNYGVSVSNIKKWNHLNSDLIYIGQKLNIGEAKKTNSSSTTKKAPTNQKEQPKADVDYNVEQLISTATSLEGTPYKWAGSDPSGFDCSGFIHYVYSQAGKDIKRQSSAGFFDRAYYVNTPQVGDLVFFENTYKSGISHMGVYLGDNQFIHAGSSGVKIESLNSSYWSKHFDSFKRFY